jgi:Na+(H+)/acetate symporter ActP
MAYSIVEGMVVYVSYVYVVSVCLKLTCTLGPTTTTTKKTDGEVTKGLSAAQGRKKEKKKRVGWVGGSIKKKQNEGGLTLCGLLLSVSKAPSPRCILLCFRLSALQ